MLLLTLLGCGVPIYACEAPFAAHEPVPPTGFLRQDGTRLVDDDGDPVPLRGVNLGGWLLWEGWIWGSELKVWHLDHLAESWMRERLETLYGDDVAEELALRLRDEWVTATDLDAIAAEGFGVVRLPVNHRLFEEPAGWEVVDRVFADAEAAGLYVVLDLHSAPGGQSAFFVADPGEVLLWDDADARADTAALWGELAARYGDAPNLAAYDLLNEPDPPDGDTLVDVYRDLIAAVRAEDSRHVIMLEGSDFARDFRMFEERLDDNLTYQAHLYTKLDGKAVARVSGFADLQTCHDVPVWMGEFGEDEPEAVGELVGAADSALAGWAFWPWKKVPNGGSPGVREIDAPGDWVTLMDDLTSGADAKGHLTEDQARAALDGFLEASHPDRLVVVDAMEEALGR